LSVVLPPLVIRAQKEGRASDRKALLKVETLSLFFELV